MTQWNKNDQFNSSGMLQRWTRFTSDRLQYISTEKKYDYLSSRIISYYKVLLNTFPIV